MIKFTLPLLFAIYFRLCCCNDFKSFDDNLLYKIDWPGRIAEPQDSDKYEPIIITTAEKEKFKCLIPTNLAKENDDEIDGVLPITPSDVISPIFSSASCSYRIEAYWTYEICHGLYIKQYHEERDGKNTKLQEYYLGKWDSARREALIKKVTEDLASNRRLKQTKIDNVNYPYLEVEMTDGTLCDLNNEARMTRVRYVCFPHGKNEVYSLKEVSTCNYEAVVLTSSLCKHRAFLPEDSEESKINCLPLEGSHERPYSWLRNELENMKIRHKLLTDNFPAQENVAVLEIDPKDGSLRLMDIIPPSDLAAKRSLKEAIEEYIEKTVKTENILNQQQSVEEDETPAKDLPPLVVRADIITPITKGHCLTGGTGWWKFKFCFGYYVRQFHTGKNSETSVMLGFFDEHLHKEWLRKNPEKRPKPKEIRTEISYLYQGGTVCETGTGEKRQTEVKLKCLENSPSPSTVSMYLLEPKTCQYILVVESPIICEMLQQADDDGIVVPQLTSNKPERPEDIQF